MITLTEKLHNPYPVVFRAAAAATWCAAGRRRARVAAGGGAGARARCCTHCRGICANVSRNGTALLLKFVEINYDAVATTTEMAAHRNG